jgi:aspartyl-tRNA synthetase
MNIDEIKRKAGQKVSIKGWVSTIRDQGGIAFLILRNEKTIIQCVVLKNTPPFNIIKHLPEESVIEIRGIVQEQEAAPNGVEVLVDTIELLSESAPELPIPIKGSIDNEAELQKRLDWRWLDLRNPAKKLIFDIWTTMEMAGRKYWVENDYIEINSPKTVGTPSEGSAELFEMDYFGQKAYLAQSPQFYKQMAMASGFGRVFETGPVFRANPSFTSRHDTEFTMWDMEISWVDSHEDVMKEEEKWLRAMIKAVAEKHGDQIQKIYGRTVIVPELPFPRISLDQAKEILKPYNIKTGKKDDLCPEEERELSRLVMQKFEHEFVFVTDYPASARPFYHMRHENNNNLTRSFDLLWNGIEITTGAQREHRVEILKKQALEKGLGLDPLEFYFNFFTYGCPPHGGIGLSPSRLLMKLLDIQNVREATYIYRGPKRLIP